MTGTAEEPVEPAKLPLFGRFADPDATTTVDLGPCRCPGTPHERDSAVVRTEIGEGEMRSAIAAGTASTGGAYYDGAVGDSEALARFTLSWTLLDAAGKLVRINRASAALLDEATRDAILDRIVAGMQAGPALPNPPGAPSRDSSRASASRTRTPRRRR